MPYSIPFPPSLVLCPHRLLPPLSFWLSDLVPRLERVFLSLCSLLARVTQRDHLHDARVLVPLLSCVRPRCTSTGTGAGISAVLWGFIAAGPRHSIAPTLSHTLPLDLGRRCGV
eukprot:6201668-Pleurochrysis_carterae.AAC.5